MRALIPLLIVLASGADAEPWQGITALAVSADGRWFATGGREGEVIVWETASGEIQSRWTAARLPVAGIAFSADGSSVGLVTLDGACSQARLGDDALSPSDTKTAWSVLAGASVQVLQRSPLLYGSTASWNDLRARGKPDGTITVTPQNGASVTWQAHDAAVTALAFTPDGVLISAGYDGSVGRWDPRTGKALGRL